jgi:GNAT superfamily N-acetyltransferase
VELARLAVAADMVVVAELLDTALTAVRTQRGGATLVGSTSTETVLGRWDANGGHTAVYVGEYHHAVVGLAAVTALARVGSTTFSGRIECCYVEPDARGVGVGTALMDAMVSWCRDAGCRDMDALALPGDRSSKQRLEAAGFVARLLTLNRQLD